MPDNCPVCGEETKRTVTMFGGEMVINVPCACRRAEIEAERKEEERRRIAQRTEDLRRRCFGHSALRGYTFEQDDGKLPKVSAAMRRYADKWQEMKAENMGILLHGPVGGGKTFYAACIANALIAQGVPVKMTNFADVVNELQASFSGRQYVLDDLARVPLLILDDLGIERETSYMQEQVYNIVDARYRAQRPLIVTTNIPIGQITGTEDLAYKRIYDRVLEMCHPIKIDIPSRRREKVNAQREHREKLLGV